MAVVSATFLIGGGGKYSGGVLFGLKLSALGVLVFLPMESIDSAAGKDLLARASLAERAPCLESVNPC